MSFVINLSASSSSLSSLSCLLFNQSKSIWNIKKFVQIQLMLKASAQLPYCCCSTMVTVNVDADDDADDDAATTTMKKLPPTVAQQPRCRRHSTRFISNNKFGAKYANKNALNPMRSYLLSNFRYCSPQQRELQKLSLSYYSSSYSCCSFSNLPYLISKKFFSTKTFDTMEKFINKTLKRTMNHANDDDDDENNKNFDNVKQYRSKINEFAAKNCTTSMIISNSLSSSSSSTNISKLFFPKDKVLKIIVEGNIGSGKTTFLSQFSDICSGKKFGNPMIFKEPVDLWRDVGGINVFQLAVDDPKRWAFTFQTYVQFTMLKIHQIMPENKQQNVKVMERSLYSARYCFVENLLRSNLITKCEYSVLDKWFQNSCESAPIDLIIYLRTDPNIVFDRIHRRGRPEESNMTLDYLKSLHDLHEEWLIEEKFPLPAPVLTIDANIPLDKITSIYEEKTGGILRQYQASFA